MIPLLRSDLFLVLFATLLAAAFAWLEAPLALRLPFGLLAVLFLPGYSMSLALLPRSHDLDGPERLALSFGLSLATITVLALGLHYLPLGLSTRSMVFTLTGWTLLATVAAWWRQQSLAPEARASFLPEGWSWQRTSRATKLALGVLMGSAMLAGAALALTLTASARFTEFYVLGPEGLAENYPKIAAPGEPITVTVAISNQEGRAATYTVRVEAEATTLAALGPLVLAAKETWKAPVTFVLQDLGDDREIDLLLFRDGEVAPSRHLKLWINVVPTSVSP